MPEHEMRGVKSFVYQGLRRWPVEDQHFVYECIRTAVGMTESILVMRDDAIVGKYNANYVEQISFKP